LQPLTRRLFAGPVSHVYLPVGQFLTLSADIAQPRRQGQTMITFKHLRRLDNAAGFPPTQPHLAVQPYPAGDNMNVIVVGVLMTHGDIRRVRRIKAHAFHEVVREVAPLFGTQTFPGRQRQGAMPDRLAYVRAQLPHGGKLQR
jgi:hypothetical protein